MIIQDIDFTFTSTSVLIPIEFIPPCILLMLLFLARNSFITEKIDHVDKEIKMFWKWIVNRWNWNLRWLQKRKFEMQLKYIVWFLFLRPINDWLDILLWDISHLNEKVNKFFLFLPFFSPSLSCMCPKRICGLLLQ